MSEKSLKKQTVSGAIWKFAERVLAELVHFVVSIILARLLMPDDYGLIALVIVFTTICDKLLVAGFATSLIQKKDSDNTDFSTVLYFSYGASIVLYAGLFFTAPFIANFYNHFDRDLLISVIRVFGLSLFLVAFNSVQNAYVSKNMLFKRNFWSKMGATLTAGCVGISMAYNGFGVWALVASNMVRTFVGMTIIFFTVKWRPTLVFSMQRLGMLFSYGWKIFASSMIKVLYNNLRSLVIGKVYAPADLAFYNRGLTLPQMVDSNVTGTIDAVLFPAYSKLQDDKPMMVKAMRRAVKTSCYILMPMLALMAAVSSPLVSVLLTDKWLPCVPYMQVLCLSFMFSPVETENLQSIKAIGRSDIVLKLEITKRTIGVLLLVCAVPIGIMAITWTMAIGNIIAAMLNAYPNKKLIGYSVGLQLLDVLPSLIMSIVVFAVGWGVTLLMNDAESWIQLISGCICGFVTYILLSIIFRVEAFTYMINTLRRNK